MHETEGFMHCRLCACLLHNKCVCKTSERMATVTERAQSQGATQIGGVVSNLTHQQHRHRHHHHICADRQHRQTHTHSQKENGWNKSKQRRSRERRGRVNTSGQATRSTSSAGSGSAALPSRVTSLCGTSITSPRCPVSEALQCMLSYSFMLPPSVCERRTKERWLWLGWGSYSLPTGSPASLNDEGYEKVEKAHTRAWGKRILYLSRVCFSIS